MNVVLIHNTTKYLVMHYSGLIGALMAAGHKVTIAAPSDQGTSALDTLGAAYVETRVSRRGLNPVKELEYLFAIRGILKRLKPDVVLCFSIKPIVYGVLAARLAKVPRRFAMVTGLGYVFTNQSSFPGRLLYLLVKLQYRAAFHYCAKVFFQNADDRALFVRENLVRKEGTVVLDGTGIDTTEYAPASEGAVPLSFLFVGRLLYDKGVEEYVDAARRVKARHPDIAFRILGPHDDNPAAIDAARLEEWRKEGVVEYLGETEDVRPALRAAAVFVLPSYREGMPRATLEAMAMGKPVITTDVPGCRETVIEGVSGYLVAPRSADQLAVRMMEFVENPDLIDRMGKKSREYAVARFDVRKVNERIISNLFGVSAV